MSPAESWAASDDDDDEHFSPPTFVEEEEDFTGGVSFEEFDGSLAEGK